MNPYNPSDRLPNPFRYSEQPFLYWKTYGIDFGLEEAIIVPDALSNQNSPTPFRAINCYVDPTFGATDGDIVYLAENGEQLTYRPWTSGVHILVGYQIISIGDAIEQTRFQVGF